jgi:hypothetical protein
VTLVVTLSVNKPFSVAKAGGDDLAKLPFIIKETELQADILDYLDYKGVKAWRNNTGGYYRNGRYIGYGVLGSPDIIGIMSNGQFLGIETKTDKAALTKRQQEWHKDARRNNALIITARRLEDVTEKL